MHKFLYRRSKPRNFYILIAFGMLVAIATALSAWAVGNLRIALDMGITQIVWSAVILVVTRNISRRRETKKANAPKITLLRRGVVIFINTFLLLALVYGVVMLAMVALLHDKPLYLILMVVWSIIVSGGHLFFAPLGDYIVSSRSWWRF